jgi:4,5:9,10-diseco-3-hydroxy-5,9,17-trioxoandrosta-1(10),2-diene-4-oate hydrolase
MSKPIVNRPLQDQYIELDSVKIRYWSAGEGEPIILLHGGNSCIEIWSFNINELAKHYRVYAFDMVGHGLSDKPAADYSLDYQLGFLQCFMDALDINRATLIGNSMGGSIALKFAIQFPQRVNKLILVSSFGLGREIDFFKRILATFPFFVNLSRPSRQGAKAMLSSCVYNPQSLPAEWVELSYQYFKVPNKKRTIQSMVSTNFNFWGLKNEVFQPIVTQLKNINAPTLVFWGKQDKVIPVKHANIAAKQIPTSRLHVFDRCGHWAQVEYSEEFNQMTLDFLQQN